MCALVTGVQTCALPISLVYFGKDIHELTLGEIATIAGLPKAPSRDNPIANPKRAHDRRDYVLGRMHELGNISDAKYQAARAEPDTVHPYQARVAVDAHYAARSEEHTTEHQSLM